MKILDTITMRDVIDYHFGYSDYQGKWYETYTAKGGATVLVCANPSPMGNGVFDWLTLSMLTEEEWEVE